MNFGKTPDEIEHKRRTFLIAMYAWAGAVFLLPLGTYALLSDRLLLGAVLLVNWAMSFGLMLIGRLTTHLKLASFLFGFQAGGLAIFLVLQGGVEGSGVYFSFPLVIAMLMLGYTTLWSGVLLSLFVVGTVALGLYGGFHGVVDYPEAHKIRITLGLLAVCIMSMISESMRKVSYAAITDTAEKLSVDANSDQLTGLLNRRGFEIEIGKMDQALFPAVLGVIDMDHFKQINDQFGHDAGDEALCFLGAQLKKSIKGRDLNCRWGGEEFLVLLTHVTLESGEAILEQIREDVSASVLNHEGRTFRMTFSAGLVELRAPGDFLGALKQADQLLYQAKMAGRNRVVSERLGATLPHPT